MKLITFRFHPKLFLYLVLGFILCTIIGTVTHELGHAVVTASQGRSFTVHYASMSPGKSLFIKHLNTEYEKYKDKIEKNEPSPEKDAYIKFRKSIARQYRYQNLYMTLGGPLQTMLFGTTGFLLLWFRRKKIRVEQTLSVTNWLLVLLSFFWSRQPAILLQKIYYSSIGHHGIGDEENIARHLHLNEWSVITLWGIAGTIILVWITFYAVPLQQRLTFIAAGLTGSLLGAALWFGVLGPAILP